MGDLDYGSDTDLTFEPAESLPCTMPMRTNKVAIEKPQRKG